MRRIVMDADRFDSLLRTFATRPSRREMSRALAALLLRGVLPAGHTLPETAAKKKHKEKKKKKGGRGSPPASSPPPGPTAPPAPPSPPSPSGATCSDNVRNGRETDVDCGGPDCPRCFAGQACAFHEDCRTARCVDGVCRECADHEQCGGDAGGFCECHEGSCINTTRNGNRLVASCSECRADESCTTPNGIPVCHAYCGSSRTCALTGVNACVAGDTPCGRG